MQHMQHIGTLMAALAALTSVSTHAASIEAIGNATVQPAGPRTGSNGLAFLNIEGSANGSFASYGVARFDLSSIKSQFDAQYGVGGWQIDRITLQLTQSNAAFTTDGDVGVFFTSNDTAALTAPSTLTYDSYATSFPDAGLVSSYTFHETSTGAVDSYALFTRGAGNTVGAGALAMDAMGGGLTTILLRDQSAGVAATYAGYSNFTYAGPTLVIDAVAAVPEPAAYALMTTGAYAIVAVARRRRSCVGGGSAPHTA